MKLNKNLLLLSTLLSVAVLSGCNLNKNDQDDANTKLAYASSSALSLVNTSSSSIQRAKNTRRALSFNASGLEETFSGLVAQFDTIFDANQKVEVEIIENESGEFKYTNNITIGENDEFTYTLNYNKEVSEEKVTDIGELVINYAPRDFVFTLNYESSIVYSEEYKGGIINFKLYIDIFNKENTTSYVEVNEVISTNDLTKNRFDYKLVVNDISLINYSIEIPVADDNTFVLKMGELTFEVKKSEYDGETSIIISLSFGDTNLFSIVFHKVEEDGKVKYYIATAN